MGDNKDLKIRAVSDKRIFCLYSALNAAVYDRENGKEMHKVRKYMREYIKNKQPSVKNLVGLFEKHPAEYYYIFRLWTLCHSDPPKFSETNNKWREKDGGDLDEFADLLAKFWFDGNLDNLWQLVQPEYSEAVKECDANGYKAVKDSLAYLKLTTLDLDEFVIIPNLLDSYNTGLGPRLDGVAYAILGPSENGFSVSRIEHEFLHSIINPLTSGINLSGKGLSEFREGLINAIVLRINMENRGYYNKKYFSLKTRGNTDYYLNICMDFEKSSRSFDDYIKSLGPIKNLTN